MVERLVIKSAVIYAKLVLPRSIVVRLRELDWAEWSFLIGKARRAVHPSFPISVGEKSCLQGFIFIVSCFESGKDPEV